MIDPITALATFNAACAVVKEASNHAGDIMSVFKGIGDMMKARDAVNQAVKNNPEKSDLELYAAHVEMEQQWNEVKEMLKWSGHWDKYLQFCADRREAEKQAKLAKVREKQKKLKLYQDIAIIIGGVLFTVGVIAVFLWAISEAKA